MKRRTAVVAAMLLLVVAAWQVLAGRGDNGRWQRVERDDLVIEVEVTGTLEAVDSAQIKPPRIPGQWSYKIAMMAPEGEEVAEDTPVAAFDANELQQRLDRTLTELESARKKIEKKNIDLAIREAADALRVAEAEATLRKARLKAERPPELVSSIDFEKAELDLELAERALAALHREIAANRRAGEASLAALQSDLGRAESDVAELQVALARMTVTAPRDGIVIYSTNWQNEKKKVGDTCWLDESLMEIPDLSLMAAEGEVEEAEAGQVTVGQRVRLRLDAHPDVDYSGTVSEISRMVRAKSRRNPLKVVRLEIELDETDPDRMRPAMRFRGWIETERIPNVVLLPLSSVEVSPDGPVVFLRGLGGTRAVPVSLGRRSRESVEVLDGVAEGDSIRSTPPIQRGKG